MPSSLNCYRLISSFLVITRFSPPDIVFYFRFGKLTCRLTDYQKCVTLYLSRVKVFLCAFPKFPCFVKEWGFFFSLLDLLTLPYWECIRPYWHCRDTDLYSLAFLTSISIDHLPLLVNCFYQFFAKYFYQLLHLLYIL